MMKRHIFLNSVFLPLLVSIYFCHSCARQTRHVADTLKIDNFLKGINRWMSSEDQSNIAISSVVLAGFLSFIAASISSAGGIGGGGLFVPILIILAGLDLKTASAFSAFMVTGGSVANVLNNVFIKVSKSSGETLIDYDIAILSEPCMLLGVSIGVICNVAFPEWLITLLFALFLLWSTFTTCKTGFLHWNLESENGLLRNGDFNEEMKGGKESLLSKDENQCKVKFPWKKWGILLVVWLAFFVLYLLRGSKYGQFISLVEPCGVGYWIISSLQIPVAIIFTAWFLYQKEHLHDQLQGQQVCEDLTRVKKPNKILFPAMALLAGTLGGVFGIGGGMLISPLLLQVGVEPEITSATCSFMVFFSSIMSAIQYLMLGVEHIEIAVVLAIVCFIGSLVGLVLVQKAIKEYGRASLIIFSVGIVMALSAILMTTFEAVDIWKDFAAGKYMGFRQPC